MAQDEDAEKAWRLVRRAAEASSSTERDTLLRRAARLVGREEQRRLWRKIGLGE
jgi:hypothetical protein